MNHNFKKYENYYLFSKSEWLVKQKVQRKPNLTNVSTVFVGTNAVNRWRLAKTVFIQFIIVPSAVDAGNFDKFYCLKSTILNILTDIYCLPFLSNLLVSSDPLPSTSHQH